MWTRLFWLIVDEENQSKREKGRVIELLPDAKKKCRENSRLMKAEEWNPKEQVGTLKREDL